MPLASLVSDRDDLYADTLDHREKPGVTIDPDVGPTKKDYQACARIASETSEGEAVAVLAKILPLAHDPVDLRNVGIWFWSWGHRRLAVLVYGRSIEISPQAATYFHLAVCYDDMGLDTQAEAAIAKCYKLAPSGVERKEFEQQLLKHRKTHRSKL